MLKFSSSFFKNTFLFCILKLFGKYGVKEKKKKKEKEVNSVTESLNTRISKYMNFVNAAITVPSVCVLHCVCFWYVSIHRSLFTPWFLSFCHSHWSKILNYPLISRSITAMFDNWGVRGLPKFYIYTLYYYKIITV